MDASDVAEARLVLRELLDKVENGELEASPLLLARLTGALDALDQLAGNEIADA